LWKRVELVKDPRLETLCRQLTSILDLEYLVEEIPLDFDICGMQIVYRGDEPVLRIGIRRGSIDRLRELYPYVDVVEGCIEDRFDAYVRVSRMLCKEVRRVLSKYLFEDREYALHILDDCRIVTMEGFRDHVPMPIPSRMVIFSAHTHPAGFALPSRNDLRVFLSIVSEGGLGIAIVSRTSTLCMYRKAPLSPEDYELICDWINRFEDYDLLTVSKKLSTVAIEFV